MWIRSRAELDYLVEPDLFHDFNGLSDPAVATEFSHPAKHDDESWKLTADDIAEVVMDLLRHPSRSLPSKVDTPIQVKSNSWVELRAANGDILAMTYVRAGESYVIPAGIAYRVIDAR